MFFSVVGSDWYIPRLSFDIVVVSHLLNIGGQSHHLSVSTSEQQGSLRKTGLAQAEATF